VLLGAIHQQRKSNQPTKRLNLWRKVRRSEDRHPHLGSIPSQKIHDWWAQFLDRNLLQAVEGPNLYNGLHSQSKSKCFRPHNAGWLVPENSHYYLCWSPKKSSPHQPDKVHRDLAGSKEHSLCPLSAPPDQLDR